MDSVAEGTFVAFLGARRVAQGDLAEVVAATKRAIDQGGRESVAIFDGTTSELVEVDFRGSMEEVLERIGWRIRPSAPKTPSHSPGLKRGPGRPRLGVVAREVTLLPQHWAWLSQQPGGASVVLRKLVHEAMRDTDGKDRIRRAQEAAYRFLAAMAGNLPEFEEAIRALYRRDAEGFVQRMERWPADIRDHAQRLALAAFEAE